jgi:hypothetical protein
LIKSNFYHECLSFCIYIDTLQSTLNLNNRAIASCKLAIASKRQKRRNKNKNDQGLF